MSESGSLVALDRRGIVLATVFVTALVTSQIISSKLVAIGAFIVPGGTIAYAATFYATDCIGELYGKRTATAVVRIAFFANFILLALVWATILLPSAGGVDAEAFRSVLGPSTNIVLGSLIAYLVSQHADVYLFDTIRRVTEGRYLWLRNLASTGTAQLIDTTIFVAIAFLLAPMLLGVGVALPANVLVSLVVGQYVVKLLLALIDTPLVYITVRRVPVSARREAA